MKTLPKYDTKALYHQARDLRKATNLLLPIFIGVMFFFMMSLIIHRMMHCSHIFIK